jgi:hypothetical protein
MQFCRNVAADLEQQEDTVRIQFVILLRVSMEENVKTWKVGSIFALVQEKVAYYSNQ